MVLPLAAATTVTSGAKSTCCAQLARLEQELKGRHFKTPAGCVLPFGSMDVAIKVLVGSECVCVVGEGGLRVALWQHGCGHQGACGESVFGCLGG